MAISKAGEFIYDHPFQWGSKKTGPDLAREGGKYPDSWHYNHLLDPASMSPGSIMPPYPWLLDDKIDTATTAKRIRVMQTLGVPYPEGFDQQANADLLRQASEIKNSLKKDKIETSSNAEIVALIAYLQRLGTDIKDSRQRDSCMRKYTGNTTKHESNNSRNRAIENINKHKQQNDYQKITNEFIHYLEKIAGVSFMHLLLLGSSLFFSC